MASGGEKASASGGGRGSQRGRGGNRSDDENALEKVLTVYRFALRTNPVLVKGITSGVISSLGNLVAQCVSPQGPGGTIAWRSIAAFGVFNGVVTGPLTHYFYRLLEGSVPRNMKYSSVYRVAVDRLVFAPPYLLAFFFVVALMEGLSVSQAAVRVRQVFWTALKMNWKVWTVAQYVNFAYVPQQYRVLFANMISFMWNIYLAMTR